MEKNIIIGLLVLILCASFVYATNMSVGTVSLPASAYRIQVTLVNQRPDPVGPGEIVEVRFKFENRGGENAEDITVELLPDYPFSLYTDEDAVKQIGSIYGRQIGKTGVIVKYKLRVDENAIEGENDLELRYRISNFPWIKLDPFKIDIQTEDAILSVEDVRTKTDTIKPGEKGTVDITLWNMADSLLKDIKVKLNLDDVPFVAIESTNEKTIKKLDSGEEIKLEFKIMAEADAESKVYKLPLKISYSDELGTKYSINSSTGLLVYSEPKLQVDIEKSNLLQKDPVGVVVFSIANIGPSKINYLNIEVLPSNDYMVIPDSSIYVGNLDPDDYESAEFTIHVLNPKLKEVPLKLLITYKNAYNEDESKTKTIYLKLFSKVEAVKMGLREKSKGIGIAITIIIIVLGLLGYLKWKKMVKK